MNFPSSVPYSIAAALPQPASEVFTTDALALYRAFDRDTYFAAFGVQAPTWDPARPPKAWFDSAANASSPNISGPSTPAVYTIVGQDQDGNWSLQPMTLKASEAATVNLTGAMTYSQYQPAPTKATRVGQIVNSVYMVLEADARLLMSEVRGAGLFDEGATTKTPVLYPATEERRMWAFQVNGQQYYAGILLASKYGLGIGWPGHWNFSRGYPLWISDPPAPTGVLDSRPPVPTPVRGLLPNERIQAGPMGLGVVVVRTDLEAATKAASGFTAEDRMALQKILEILSRSAA